VAELSEARTLEALDALTRLDLVRSAYPPPLLAFRHPVICQFIYDRMEPGKRLAAHLRAEAELIKRSASIVARAYHISRAAHSGRPEHATTLIAAASETIHSAPATSADWLCTALRLIDRDDERWYEAQMLLARARLLSGRRTDSRDLLHTLLAHAGGTAGIDFASTVESAGRAERLLGRYAEAGALAREGLAAHVEIPPPVAAALHTELANLAHDQQDNAAACLHAGDLPSPGAVPAVSLAKLTEREREIAALAGKGMTSVRMARELFLSARTVETHLSRIYRKLGLSNRAGLVRAVVETGDRGLDP
jgi:DNA-binding CsgD family transcriptional regulator